MSGKHLSIGCRLTPHKDVSMMNKFDVYTEILSKRKKFNQVIHKIGSLNINLPYWTSIDDAIVYSVIGQMLSNSASASIISFLHKQVGTSHEIINWASNTYMLSGPIYGVSQRKRRALYEWRKYISLNSNAWMKWGQLPIEEYRKEISSIWGFGRWSADMIGIFYFGRMDVWPENDTGIKNACKVLFGHNNTKKIKKYVCNCETLAALYLWELINRKILKDFINDYGQLNKRAKT